MARDVFISYASEDLSVAEKVCAALEAAGVGCWMAPRDVPYGASYEEAIMDGIASSRLVVLVLSAHSNASPHVKREIQNACAEDAGKQIVPLRIDDISYNKALRYYLGSSQWLDASAPPLEQHLGRLVEHVRSTLTRAGDGGTTRPEQAPDERAHAQAPEERAHGEAPEERAHPQATDERARAQAASLTDEAPRGRDASHVRATPRVHDGSHAQEAPHLDADSGGGLPRAAIIGGGVLLLVLVGVLVAILALSGDRGGASNANNASPAYVNANNASPTPTRTPTSTPTPTPTPTPTATPAPTRRIIVPQGNYNIRRLPNRNN